MLTIKKQKYISKACWLIFLILISLSIANCGGDPVIYFEPKDFVKEEHPWFAKSFGVVDLKITDIGGITIQKSLTPEMIIKNRGKDSVSLENAILKAGDSQYKAKLSDNNERNVIFSQAQNRLALEFEFDKSIDEVLIKPVEIIINLKLGNESKQISIPMIKQTARN